MSDDSTPMMKQYRRIRGELPAGTILLFRLGDFYEMFFEDAKDAALILEIALTRRHGMPMCGVPFHSVDGYVAKLLRAGRKVAICEQMEDPAAAKGIVKRDVTRIVTPGTATEESVLQAKEHHYLAGLCRHGETLGLALLDLSTGEFQVEEASSPAAVRAALQRAAPAECVLPADQETDPAICAALSGVAVLRSPLEEWVFDYDAARDHLIRHFKVHSLEGFGCEGRRAAVGAAGGAFYYVRESLRRQVGHIRSLRVHHASDFMILDEATASNLDLLPSGVRRVVRADLLNVLDVTRTPMGARLLREWLLRPLAREEAIRSRHDAVEALVRDRALLAEVRAGLEEIRDLERLVVRLSGGSGNARDLKVLGLSLAAIPAVRGLIADPLSSRLAALAGSLTPEPELAELIETAIVDDPPLPTKEGGMIRPGYNAELDELRRAATQGKQWLAEYQSREIERTGIKTLKVRHNRVFGYYIEVSRGQAANAPADYTRKQTLVNAERFITPELKEYEHTIMGAQERSTALEYELFADIRARVVARMDTIQATARALAELDVFASFADRALANRYVRPVIGGESRVVIRDGRHPVVETLAEAERFVPNDTRLDRVENQLLVITGPNMAGKSTYIRQVALIVILAQAGSFVPAASAEIGIVDRVFTRVGASDDLARGRSTFMVEMQETANILNNATPRSLVVLDEIGRGTSTFDGISIAWAVAEHLHNIEAVKAMTLFATHYHELTDLALTMQGVKNYSCLARDTSQGVVFLRRIVPGAADKSYGIQVARLAGLPDSVIDRAREILSNLEEGEFGEAGQPKIARRRQAARKNRDEPADGRQMDLFGSPSP
ncbi:MAG: DNA mismatch repair protein MutS [Kiritimatiellia bacterium]